MTIYHQTESGCIRIISSEDIMKQPYFSLYTPCDLDHEDSNPAFVQDILAHDDAPPYHVRFQKVECFRRDHLDKTMT